MFGIPPPNTVKSNKQVTNFDMLFPCVISEIAEYGYRFLYCIVGSTVSAICQHFPKSVAVNIWAQQTIMTTNIPACPKKPHARILIMSSATLTAIYDSFGESDHWENSKHINYADYSKSQRQFGSC